MVNLPADTSIVCPIVIGRQTYIDSLDRLLSGVADGNGKTIAISGEAGIGKSRLVAEMSRRATAAPYALRVLRGHCFEPDATMPYGPLVDLLRSMPASELADATAEAPELAQIFPEAARAGSIPAPVAADPEQEKRRLFTALSQQLLKIASRQPLLIVVEDLHWCDDTSLEFLLQLARRVPAEPVLLVITFRSDEAQRSLRKMLSGLDRERLALEWPLARLDQAQVAQMITAIFDLQAPVRPDTMEAIYPLTEGNPFFIEEVLKSLVSSGDIYFEQGAWDRKPIEQLRIPRSIQDAVRERTDRLSSEARRVLALAAVTGRRFDFALLQRLAVLDEDALLGVIKELIDAQIVVEESADHFSFRHALTQQAIYSQLLARERRSLHGTIAESMQQLYAANLDAHLAELAHHFYEANAWEEAYQYARRVTERAQTLHASRAVVEHATRALEAATHMNMPPPASIYRMRGQAYELLGEFDAARADYERAFDASRADGDRAAEWQSLVDLGFLWTVRDYERTGTFFRRASELASAIGDPMLQARSLNRMGNWLVNIGSVQKGIALHDEALAIFESANDVQARAETLDLLGMANGMLGDTSRAVECAGQAIELLRPLGASAVLCSSLASRVTYSSNAMNDATYRIVRTDADLAEEREFTAEVARQIGGSAALSYAAWTTASAFSGDGRMGEAIATAREGLRIATEVEHLQWMTGAAFTLGQAYALVLAADEAIVELAPAFERARTIGSAWWTGNCGSYLALGYLLNGDLDHAQAVLDTAWNRGRPPNALAERRVLWVSALLDLERRRPEAALAAAECLLDTAPGVLRGQRIPAILHLKGDALAALGRPTEALASLEDAKAGALERGAAPFLWPIHRSLGRLHQAGRRANEAAREFDAARSIIDAMAHSLDDGTVRDGFVRAALGSMPTPRPATANRAAKLASGGLTGREREVAVLIAGGKSNREIAEQLVLGERTIETHVGNVLSKLGFSSRSQIAAWAVATGLVSP